MAVWKTLVFMLVIGHVCSEQLTSRSRRSVSYAVDCSLMGSAKYPAISCDQIHKACGKPSGSYFIHHADSGIYKQVYCDMETEGGGWTLFGKSNMSAEWKYVNEDETQVLIDVIGAEDVKLMASLEFSHFLVKTDVTFQMVGDDSHNPSFLVTRKLPWLTDEKVFIPGYANDHTRIEFADDANRLICIPGGSSKCGAGGGLPYPNESTDHRLFIESILFAPRSAARGASLSSNLSGQWHRNKYTWNGSYYFVLAK